MFAVELTQVSADFGNNFCIKSLFIDLFEGRADGNRAIIVKKLNLPFIHLEDIEQIKSFLSDDIILSILRILYFRIEVLQRFVYIYFTFLTKFLLLFEVFLYSWHIQHQSYQSSFFFFVSFAP